MVRPVELQQVFSRFEICQCESVPAIQRGRRNQMFLIGAREFDGKLLNVFWSIVGEVNNSGNPSLTFAASGRLNRAEHQWQQDQQSEPMPAATFA